MGEISLAFFFNFLWFFCLIIISFCVNDESYFLGVISLLYFQKSNIKEIESLIKKDVKDFTESDKTKIKSYSNNYKKIETTKKLMQEIKKINFVE